jgi:O-antigen/teichoic acid export membrane protein
MREGDHGGEGGALRVRAPAEHEPAGNAPDDPGAGRSARRYRNAFLTIGGTAVTRGLQAAFSLVTVPLALTYFGPERYGLWLTMGSLLTLLVYLDLGFGNALVQVLAHAHGREDREEQRRYVSAATFTAVAAGVSIFALVLATYPVVPWARVFGVGERAAAADAGPSVIVLAAAFAFSAVAGVGQRVYLAHQRGFVGSLSQTLGSALALAGVVAVVRLRLGLPWLVATGVGGPAIAAALSSAALFWRRPWLVPRLAALERGVVRELARGSVLFVAIQGAYGATLAADAFLVAQMLGPEAVPGYAIPARLFYVLQTLLSVVPQAFWPACREALARGDVRWARRAFRVSLLLTAGGAAATGALLCVVGNELLRLWVRGQVTASPALLGGLALLMLVYSVGAATWTYAVALGAVASQMRWSVVVLVASVALRAALLPRLGVASLPYVMAACYLVAYVAPGAAIVASSRRRGDRSA